MPGRAGHDDSSQSRCAAASKPSTAGCCCCRPWRCWRCSPIGRRSRPSSTAYSTPRPRRAVDLRRPRQLPADARRPGVLAGALVNNLWFALGTIPVSIALALLMALWVNDRIAGRAAGAHGLLHADRAADDRGRQHLAVLLHAAVRPAGAGARRCSACASHNWLGSQDTALACVTSWRSGRRRASS